MDGSLVEGSASTVDCLDGRSGTVEGCLENRPPGRVDATFGAVAGGMAWEMPVVMSMNSQVSPLSVYLNNSGRPGRENCAEIGAFKVSACVTIALKSLTLMTI